MTDNFYASASVHATESLRLWKQEVLSLTAGTHELFKCNYATKRQGGPSACPRTSTHKIKEPGLEASDGRIITLNAHLETKAQPQTLGKAELRANWASKQADLRGSSVKKRRGPSGLTFAAKPRPQKTKGGVNAAN